MLTPTHNIYTHKKKVSEMPNMFMDATITQRRQDDVMINQIILYAGCSNIKEIARKNIINRYVAIGNKKGTEKFHVNNI